MSHLSHSTQHFSKRSRLSKYPRAIIIALLAFCILITAYLTSFNINGFNENFYKEEFKKYRIYERFPSKDIDDIDKLNSGLLLYLRGRREDFALELFNDKEVEHLRDVRMLLHKIRFIYYSILVLSALLASALFLLDKKRFIKNFSAALFFGGTAVLFTAVALLISIKLDFSRAFEAFHYVLFPQGGWMFSSSDAIIRLYPSELFYDAAKRIFKWVLVYGNILILGGIPAFFCKDNKEL